VCAVWSDHETGVVECYAEGAERGSVVPADGASGQAPLALSYAGTSLAWTADGPTGVPDLVYARLTGSTAGTSTRVPAWAPGEEPDEAVLVVGDLAWEGENTLLVSHGYDDDVNGAIARVSLTAPPKGWTHAYMVDGGDQVWPVLYGLTSATDAGIGLALQLGFFGSNGAELTRAVEIDVATGQVASVVSLPAKNRRLSSVSGGADGVLYRTEGSDGRLATYWRAPGQAHGRPLAGLPADVSDVVAQP
jgi:hypothetical protein